MIADKEIYNTQNTQKGREMLMEIWMYLTKRTGVTIPHYTERTNRNIILLMTQWHLFTVTRGKLHIKKGGCSHILNSHYRKLC